MRETIANSKPNRLYKCACAWWPGIREFKQIATAGATTAAVTEKVWGEYVAAVCQILAK